MDAISNHLIYVLPTSAVGLSMVEWLPDRIGDYDPYNFFHTWRAQFCSDATSEFEIASSRLALGVRPFFVTGVLEWFSSGG